MPELRWILVAVGVLFVAGLWFWEARRGRAGANVMRPATRRRRLARNPRSRPRPIPLPRRPCSLGKTRAEDTPPA
jgi:hypothetical protein